MNQKFLKTIDAEQKINAALSALGLTFAEGFRIVRYNPEVRTAHWKYFTSTGEEVIELGDRIINLPVVQIEMVLRHEFLHRCVFHGFGEQFDDPQISNIALDICINRLLFEAFPDSMRDLSVSFYPEESKTTILALADCSANPELLNDDIKSLWKFIWTPTSDGSYRILNPASIYFKLLKLHTEYYILLNPFSDFSEADPGIYKNIPARIVRAGSKIFQGISRRFPKGSSGGEGLDQYSVIPHQLGISDVESFIRRMNVKRVASKLATRIKEPLQRSVIMQPYPMFPTRLGYIYQIFGITDTLRLFWNKDVSSIGMRMAIGMYFDVSGSMLEHFPVISGFVDALKEYPIRMHTFDRVVKKIDVEDVIKGKITGGGGTDFNCVFYDFINDQDLAAAVVFTDGFGDLSDSSIRNLRVSKKNLYVVFIASFNNEISSAVLTGCAKDTVTINVNK